MHYRIYSKKDIVELITLYCHEIDATINSIDDSAFTHNIPSKWSIADNLEHLIRANGLLALSLRLPKFVIVQIGGKPEILRSSEEVITLYQRKLANGAKSTFTYNPKFLFKNRNITTQLWKNSYQLLLSAIESWEESDLDLYCLPHPIIGKVTIREMLFFTTYHHYHHGNTIKTLALYSKI
jgi:hypothetical protein